MSEVGLGPVLLTDINVGVLAHNSAAPQSAGEKLDIAKGIRDVVAGLKDDECTRQTLRDIQPQVLSEAARGFLSMISDCLEKKPIRGGKATAKESLGEYDAFLERLSVAAKEEEAGRPRLVRPPVSLSQLQEQQPAKKRSWDPKGAPIFYFSNPAFIRAVAGKLIEEEAETPAQAATQFADYVTRCGYSRNMRDALNEVMADPELQGLHEEAARLQIQLGLPYKFRDIEAGHRRERIPGDLFSALLKGLHDFMGDARVMDTPVVRQELTDLGLQPMNPEAKRALDLFVGCLTEPLTEGQIEEMGRRPKPRRLLDAVMV